MEAIQLRGVGRLQVVEWKEVDGGEDLRKATQEESYDKEAWIGGRTVG